QAPLGVSKLTPAIRRKRVAGPEQRLLHAAPGGSYTGAGRIACRSYELRVRLRLKRGWLVNHLRRAAEGWQNVGWRRKNGRTSSQPVLLSATGFCTAKRQRKQTDHRNAPSHRSSAPLRSSPSQTVCQRRLLVVFSRCRRSRSSTEGAKAECGDPGGIFATTEA